MFVSPDIKIDLTVELLVLIVVKDPRSLTYPSAEDLSVTDLGPLPQNSQIVCCLTVIILV